MLTLIVTLAITVILVLLARRVAPAIGLVDSPTARKSHQGEIPLVGGIAIFGALLAFTLVGDLFTEHWAFFTAAALLVVVGVLDDAVGISPPVRLAVQCLAILIIAVGGDIYLTDLGTIIPVIGEVTLGWMVIPFTVFAGVGIINAFNLSDGIDGLCGTLALVALVGFGIAAGIAGNMSELPLILALIGGLVGFLIFNVRLPHRHQASIFLGDAGSYLLGLSVAYLAIRLSQAPERTIQPVTALWFCMLPLLDTIGVLLRRVRRGRSPFDPDREHIHHVFLLADFSVTATWVGLVTIASLGMCFGLLGLVANIPESVMFAGFLILSVAYYGMFTRVWAALKFLSRSINRRALAKMDRRVGVERRQQDRIYYVNGIPKERRSGEDRRKGNGDRRSAEDPQEAYADDIDAPAQDAGSEDKAARTSSEQSPDGSPAYH